MVCEERGGEGCLGRRVHFFPKPMLPGPCVQGGAGQKGVQCEDLGPMPPAPSCPLGLYFLVSLRVDKLIYNTW